MALLYGRAGRLTAQNGGFRPGQRGPHARFSGEPAGLTTPGSDGAEVAAAVLQHRREHAHADAERVGHITILQPGVLVMTLLPVALGGALRGETDKGLRGLT